MPPSSSIASSGTPALFVSDVHLDASLPRTTEAFLHLLKGPARLAKQVYLCGDLFEYWAGDDDLASPYHQKIAFELRALASAGVSVGWLPGNRDFLVGEAFAEAAGLTLMTDPCLLTIGEKRIAVTHGDALCTDDLPYQQFRAMVRQPAWQQAFLSRPLAERKTIIAGVRQESMAGKTAKSAEIMDVNGDAVSALFDATEAMMMIHGHTHRPARHVLPSNAGERIRYVLPDWDCEHEQTRGGWMTVDAEGNVLRFDVVGAMVSFEHP